MARGTIYEHREPTEVELAWLTGIWEGEGSWTFKKGRPAKMCYENGKTYLEKPYLKMMMCMTDQDVMERVGRIMDGRKITHYDWGPAHKAAGQKPVYIISLRGEAACCWSELMKPYLGIRRREKYELIMEKINEGLLSEVA